MKNYVVFGDIHGADVTPVRQMFEAGKVDAGICLGDFDRTYTAKQVKALQEDYELHVIPGNHDYSHINRSTIYSSTMTRQGINSKMMWKEWDEDPETRIYVRNMLETITSFDKEFDSLGLNAKIMELEADEKAARYHILDIGGNKTLAIHGGLSGEYNGEPADLWNRIKTEEDYIKNFNRMAEADIKIMIRGHDHKPQFARVDPDSGFKEYDAAEQHFNMFNRRMHIVNPGAFYNGNYAMIREGKEEYPEVKFFRL